VLAIALPLLLLATPPEPAATTRPDHLSGGLGIEYRDGAGPDGRVLHSFVYPSANITVDAPYVFVDVNSPLPILLPDLIATLFVWLSTGEDDIPLWYALNGDKEPGAVRFGDATVRYPVVFGDMVAVETGATASFTLVSVLFPQPGDEPDKRISVQPRVLASSTGFRVGAPGGPNVRLSWFAGNGWTHLATWNPILGTGVRGTLPFSESFAFELRGDLAWQRLDLHRYREAVFPDPGPLAGTDWYRFWSTEARVVYRWQAK
jgi:hypothetical protein